jgi:hypothetical protein
MQIAKFLIISIGIILSGCASKAMDLNQIKELKREGLKKCEFLNSASAQTESGDEKLVLRELKIKVQEMKGSGYYIEDTVQNGANIKIAVSVYKCK